MPTKHIYDEENRTSPEEQAANHMAALHNRGELQQAIREEFGRPDNSNCTRFTKHELAHICILVGVDV